MLEERPFMVILGNAPDLLAECRKGNREAFHGLFLLYKDKVYSIALHYAGDAQAAMDITQDVFVKLFARIGEFRGEASFDSWLYRVVVNCCLDRRRRLRRMVPLAGELVERMLCPRESPAAGMEREQLRERVQSAVAKLSPDLRIAVVLRYTQGLSYVEIGEAVGVPPGTVASRLSRAHKDLARRLAHLENRNV
jgi:RNA polymerase sigma-70 factor (ECF subfamily)